MKTLHFLRNFVLLFVLTNNVEAQYPNRQLTKEAHEQTETAIALSPLNSNNLFVAYNDNRLQGFTSQAGWVFSSDAGSSWTTENVLPADTARPTYIYGYDPSVAFDRSGNVFYCFIANDVNGDAANGATYVYRSTNQGTDWAIRKQVSTGLNCDKSMMAIDNTGLSLDGRIYVTWTDISSAPFAYKIYVAVSTDNGQNYTPHLLDNPGGSASVALWSKPVKKTSSPPTVFTAAATDYIVQYAQPAVAPNGDVFVVYAKSITGSTNFKIAKSTDGGGNWTVYDTGPSFTFKDNVVAGGARIKNIPSLAIGPKGYLGRYNLYLAYVDNKSTTETDRRIWFSVSSDAGATWAPPTKIVDDSFGDWLFFPQITVDATGRITVGFMNTYYPLDPQPVMYTLAVTSSDNGTTWGVPQQISTNGYADQSNYYYDYNGIASVGNNHQLFYTWADSRNNNPDIYFIRYQDMTVSYMNNWNLASVPDTLSNMLFSYFWGQRTSGPWAFNGGYVIQNILNTGTGYWVKFPSSQNVNYKGIPMDKTTINVNAGWNMIGSISQSIPVPKVSPCNIIQSNVFGYSYNTGYYIANTFDPGKGYWIKVNSSGSLILGQQPDCNPPSTSPPPPCAPDALPSNPVLYLPADGATDQSTTLTLSWNANGDPCAASYRLQVARDTNFSTIDFDASNITQNSQAVGPLSSSRAYYWHVNATNSNGTSAWSSRWSFITAEPQPVCDCCASSISSLDQFTITDAQGNRQQLFAANGGRGLNLGFTNFEMPPEPPPGMFHARFQSNSFIEKIPLNALTNIPVAVKDAVSPLTISWNIRPENATQYWVIAQGRIPMTGSGSVAIDNPSNGTLLVQAQSTTPCPATIVRRHDNPDEGVSKPLAYALRQNMPNPFNPSTWVNYELPEDGYVTLKVYNLLGQEVGTLVNETQDAGYKTARFDGNNLSSGIYFYRLTAGRFTEVKKMLLIK